ncbi:YegP family protein [Ulvibacterium sp.]|uniref:YegP family protein n=1 Tax=Ulvibacterium sp. TaxID=2665914 RepID=UPI00261D0F85|nr:YegP family protein [Ulvibacterium sp.]
MIAIEKNNGKGYRFIVKSESGQTLLSSVPFSNRSEVRKSLKTLGNARNKPIGFERKTDHEGKFLFNLKDNAGSLIGHSSLYTSEAGMENGIKNLKNRIHKLSDLGEL